MKESKPVTPKDPKQKPKKVNKPLPITQHEYTEQISLNSSDREALSDSSSKGNKMFSRKSMSEIIKDDQRGSEITRSGKLESTPHMEDHMGESSSCSYHENGGTEAHSKAMSTNTEDKQKSVSLNELSENIRSRTELLTSDMEPTPDTPKPSSPTKKITNPTKKITDKQKEQIEIKRLKLISFLGNRINETPIEEIEEAISKMLFLTTKQFENLLDDVLNQIEERTLKKRSTNTTNSLSSFSSKQGESKLVHLNSKQFRKLCLDVFYVFEAKYPSNRANKYSELIKNLEISLKEMTSKMAMLDETNEIVFSIENERIPSKQLSIFVDYVKKIFLSHDIDTEVLMKFEDVYFKNLERPDMCLNLLDPEFLLKFTENSFDMKIQAQRKIIYLIYKKYRKSLKNSKKLDSPYKYILRKEVVNLVLLLESKRPTMKEILGNLSVLFNHLTYCCLNETNVFSKEAFLLFKCVIKGLKVINERLKEAVLDDLFVEFDEFNLKIKQEKLGKRVLNDELERLIVNLARRVLELKVVY